MNDLIVYAGVGILLIGLPVLVARFRRPNTRKMLFALFDKGTAPPARQRAAVSFNQRDGFF